jgi:hypothetical protein
MTALFALIPWEWLAAVGAVVVALAATWLGGRRSAQTAVKIETLTDEVEAHETRDKVDRDAGTGDAHKRLHKKWGR